MEDGMSERPALTPDQLADGMMSGLHEKLGFQSAVVLMVAIPTAEGERMILKAIGPSSKCLGLVSFGSPEIAKRLHEDMSKNWGRP